jgi:predicted small integral membrane protein
LAEQPISVSLVEWFVTPLYTFLGYSNSNSTSNFFDQIVILNGDETCWKVISSLNFPDFFCIKQSISASLIERFVTSLYTLLGYSNSTSIFFDQIVILNGDDTCWEVISSLIFPNFLCIKQPISALIIEGFVTSLYTLLGHSNSTSIFFDQIVILNGDETCWNVISSLDFPDFLCIKQPVICL